MPRLTTLVHGKGQPAGAGRGGGESWDCKWMEEEKERERTQTPADSRTAHWSQALQTLRPWRDWCSLAPVGAVWLFCQVEAPSADVSWRLLLVCAAWLLLGGCVHALRCSLGPAQNQKGQPPERIQQEVVMENRNIQYSMSPQSRSPRRHIPLALSLAKSLLLCLLQEPLTDPSVPHIQTLLSRLESVSDALADADPGSEERSPDEDEQDSALTDKVKLIRRYLQQRMRSLHALVQVQGDFVASVKDMLEGLDGLWAQLEELHTGVTLTKEGGQDHGDLALARTDAENLFSVLGHYRNRLHSCQTHLKDVTQLLQELTWSHTHISNSVSCSSESVWPELLLQSNIEQFDKVQESFFSVEQQTSTFQAHLEGLRKGNQEEHTRALAAAAAAAANEAKSCAVSPQTSPHLHNGRTSGASSEHCNSASSVDPDSDSESRHSLCERSALQFSSTFGRLRISGKKK
ncbi:hypothetical protein JOB18_020970 [Solea senegalensis]|uniref:Uncharacterized protein n=1 Tax=Solea senegalensis TaxID=28829 RepID=A0AAV6PZY5_SOLSE|nr:uncharacterized protein si:ch211-151h10.2 isoform X2 [Solea senegalensis]KAG7479219.1 hypothetical protein JOB18_020970 [Solea senegalensis]